MNGIVDLLKNNPGLATIFAIVLGGGGFNILSESNEDAALETLSAELHETDEIQNRKYEELLQMFNDMNLELALVIQEVTSLSSP